MGEVQGYLQCLINKYGKLAKDSCGDTKRVYGDILIDLVDFQKYIQREEPEAIEYNPKRLELVYTGKLADLPEFIRKKMEE